MSPDTHWMVQFAGGFILASAAWFAWLSVVVTNHTKESKKATRTIFNLNELITHLRQQKSPIYQVGVGVDPVARRNPKTTIESLPFLEAGDWAVWFIRSVSRTHGIQKLVNTMFENWKGFMSLGPAVATSLLLWAGIVWLVRWAAT